MVEVHLGGEPFEFRLDLVWVGKGGPPAASLAWDLAVARIERADACCRTWSALVAGAVLTGSAVAVPAVGMLSFARTVRIVEAVAGGDRVAEGEVVDLTERLGGDDRRGSGERGRSTLEPREAPRGHPA